MGLSRTQRHQIIDWIIAGNKPADLRLFGDQRDRHSHDLIAADPTLRATLSWYKARRRQFIKLTDEELLRKVAELEEIWRRVLPPRGRPKGSGKHVESDKPLMAEVLRLEASGMSRHAATMKVAAAVSPGHYINSTVRRLSRRLEKS